MGVPGTSLKDESLMSATEMRAYAGSEQGIVDHTPQLHHWPSDPQTLVVDKTTHLALNAFDLALCLMPLLLIAKIVLCLVAREVDRNHTGAEIDQVSHLTLNLIRFNSQLTTIYTIIFVLIVSTLLKRFALWRAQKGATLGHLEQYQASVSLPSTIVAIFQLRAFSITSLALVCLWAFYYLGSQANQYEYTYRDSAAYEHLPVAVLSYSAPSIFQLHDPTFSREVLSINGDLGKDIAPDANPTAKGYDTDGYALLPYLPSSIGRKVHVDKHGWQDVSTVSETVYSGWSGSLYYTTAYPVVGNYKYNTSYINANCFPVVEVPDSDFPSNNPALFLSINLTSTHREQDQPRTLTLYGNNQFNVYRTTCALTTVFVEVSVSCGPLGCTARKMRPNPALLLPSLSTPLDDYGFARELLANLQLVNGVPDASENTDLEATLSFASFTAPYTAPADIFTFLSKPLTQLLNTYYALSRNPLLTGAGLFVPNVTYIALDPPSHPYFTLSTLDGAPYNPQYYISLPWTAIDFLSNAILFVAALTAYYLRRRTLAPDIFGYVSSLTRDNAHMNLPDGGSTLGGMERARLMRDVRVRIGDVGGGQVGRVGLTYADVELDRLDRGRVYV